MKKWMILGLCVCLLLGGCAGEPDQPEGSDGTLASPSDAIPSAEGSLAPDASAPPADRPCIEMQLQVYDDDGSIVEIPRIAGPDSEGAAGINSKFSDLVAEYEGIRQDGENWLELKAYPYTGERYLQVVMTKIVYPTYGSDGEVLSFCYDMEEGREVLLREVMEQYSLVETDIAASFRAQYNGDGQITSINFAGFRLLEDGVELYLEILEDYTSVGADAWQMIYTYSSVDGQFYAYNGDVLGNIEEPDQMDPPLYYAQERTGELDELAYTYHDAEYDMFLTYPIAFSVEGEQDGDPVFSTVEGDASLKYRVLVSDITLTYPDLAAQWKADYPNATVEQTDCLNIRNVAGDRGLLVNVYLIDGITYELHVEFPAAEMDYYEALRDVLVLRKGTV